MNIVQHSREFPTDVQNEAFVQIDDSTLDAAVDAMLTDFLTTLPASAAAKEAAKLTGRPKSELYARCLALKDRDDGKP